MENAAHAKIKTLFLKHYEELCLLSYTYLHNMDEAEDVVQDVFVKILFLEKEKEILNLRSYIYAMVRNHSIKKLKKLRKIAPLREENTNALPSYEDLIIDNELKIKVQSAFEDLPNQSKKVFNLCVIEGLKYESAADSLGITTNTVKYHLKKAFKILRFSLRNLHFFYLFLSVNIFNFHFFINSIIYTTLFYIFRVLY